MQLVPKATAPRSRVPEPSTPAKSAPKKAPAPKSTISDTESGVRGDQIGKKLSAPKSVKDMMKRIRRSD